MPNRRDFVTIRAAADLIGVAPATLRKWDRSGKLDAARHSLSRYRPYRPQDAHDLLAGLVDGPSAKTVGRAEYQARSSKGRA